MLDWLTKKLGIDELKKRLANLEGRVDAVEHEVDQGLRHLYGYKERSEAELDLMKNQVTDLLETVDAVIGRLDNREGSDRAILLRRRLRNNLTRIQNARNAKGAS